MRKTMAPSRELTLRDLLSRLTYTAACRLLGSEVERLLREGGVWEVELDQVRIEGDPLRLRLRGAVATIARRDDAPGKLRLECSACTVACEQVTNKASGKTYRVALRGTERGDSFYSCPDFRKNGLGTCKHVHYGDEAELRLLRPAKLEPEIERIVRPIEGVPIEDERDLLKRIQRIEWLGRDVVVYPDAEERVQARPFRRQVAELVAGIRRDPAAHPLQRELLRAELLPYQLEGIAFAVGAGRAVLADDMGLGKTLARLPETRG